MQGVVELVEAVDGRAAVFARHLRTGEGLWSKPGSYPTVSCEAGLFASGDDRWVLAVMADGLADWGNGSTAAGPTFGADVARTVFDTWAPGS